MSLNAKKPKRTRASLPDIPLPLALAGMSMQQMLHNNQYYKAAIEKNAQHYQDSLVPVFNVGYTEGYKQGHKAGWKEAVGASREYGFKLGYAEAAKDLISGDNFILTKTTWQMLSKAGPHRSSLVEFQLEIIAMPVSKTMCSGIREWVH
jgi:hypothetical protein